MNFLETTLRSYPYIDSIVKALNNFYRNDYELILNSKYTNEMTYSFRLAMYLSKILESQVRNRKVIDCEYHGMLDPRQMLYLRKSIEGYGKCRPDIIYHIRSNCQAPNNVENNIFAIEIKKKSAGNDKQKAIAYIRELKYNESFCIYNWGRKYVTVAAFKNTSNSIQNQTIRFKFDETSSQLLPYKVKLENL